MQVFYEFSKLLHIYIIILLLIFQPTITHAVKVDIYHFKLFHTYIMPIHSLTNDIKIGIGFITYPHSGTEITPLSYLSDTPTNFSQTGGGIFILVK